MDIGAIVQLVTDGGDILNHHECRICGTNLDSGTSQCPHCGGEVATYEW